MDYIDRIKQIKSQRKITNDMLSEMTGIPLGTLSKILAGFSESPKLSNIVAICRALDCSLDYIISGTPENHHNYTLEAGEIRLVETYRKLDTHGRELSALVMDKELQRVTCSEYEASAPAPQRKVISGEDLFRRIAESRENPRLGKREILARRPRRSIFQTTIRRRMHPLLLKSAETAWSPSIAMVTFFLWRIVKALRWASRVSSFWTVTAISRSSAETD